MIWYSQDRSKKNRVWDGPLDSGKRSASQVSELDFSGGNAAAAANGEGNLQQEVMDPVDEKAQELVGTMSGDLQGLVDDDNDDDDGNVLYVVSSFVRF